MPKIDASGLVKQSRTELLSSGDVVVVHGGKNRDSDVYLVIQLGPDDLALLWLNNAGIGLSGFKLRRGITHAQARAEIGAYHPGISKVEIIPGDQVKLILERC